MAKRRKKRVVKDVWGKRVTLSNKSRKGEYVYYKVGKRKGRYYKVKPEVKKSAYERAYFGGLKYRKGGVRSGKLTPQKYIRQIRGRPTIFSSIRRGTGMSRVEDYRDLSDYQVRQKYKEMLKPLVRDESLLDILTDEDDRRYVRA